MAHVFETFFNIFFVKNKMHRVYETSLLPFWVLNPVPLVDNYNCIVNSGEFRVYIDKSIQDMPVKVLKLLQILKLSCLLFNLGMITKKYKKHTFKRPSLSSEYLCFTVQAIKSQNIITNATKRKSRDKNCSSMCCGVPGAAGGGRPSFILNAVAKIPNGKAPIPNDIWNPPSPNPKP